MSGKQIKDEQPQNKELKLVILSVFQLDILGNDSKLEHPPNNSSISSSLVKSHLDMSGIDFKDEQL